MVSSTFSDFQKAYEREIWCLCTVTFGQKVPKLNSRPVYCSRLYGMQDLKIKWRTIWNHIPNGTSRRIHHSQSLDYHHQAFYIEGKSKSGYRPHQRKSLLFELPRILKFNFESDIILLGVWLKSLWWDQKVASFDTQIRGIKRLGIE